MRMCLWSWEISLDVMIIYAPRPIQLNLKHFVLSSSNLELDKQNSLAIVINVHGMWSFLEDFCPWYPGLYTSLLLGMSGQLSKETFWSSFFFRSLFGYWQSRSHCWDLPGWPSEIHDFKSKHRVYKCLRVLLVYIENSARTLHGFNEITSGKHRNHLFW